jgi:hypothetical protein
MMTLLGVRLPNGVPPGRTIGMFEKDLGNNWYKIWNRMSWARASRLLGRSS